MELKFNLLKGASATSNQRMKTKTTYWRNQCLKTQATTPNDNYWGLIYLKAALTEFSYLTWLNFKAGYLNTPFLVYS